MPWLYLYRTTPNQNRCPFTFPLRRDQILVAVPTTKSATLGSASIRTSYIFAPEVYDTTRQGQIAVIPDFLPSSEVAVMQRDAQTLYASKHFSTDALATY